MKINGENLLSKDNSDLQGLRNIYRFESWPEFFVILAYVICCFHKFLGWHIEPADALGRYLTAFLLIISFKFGKWDKFKIFLVVFLFMALAVRRWLVPWTLLAMVYQIDYLKIPIKKLAAIGFTTQFLIILLQIIFVLCGIWENVGIEYEKSDQILYDLGTGNANRIATRVTFMVLCLYILMKDNYRWLFPVISLIIGFIFFQVTGSRTTLYSIIILNILAIVYWCGLFWNWTKYLIALVPLVLFFGTFYLAANMETNEELSESASGRLYYILKFTREYGTKEWMLGAVREESDPLDSSYLDIIVTGGIMMALVFCIGFGTSVIKYYKKIKSYLPFMLAFLAAGLTESYFTYPDAANVLLWVLIMQAFIKYKPILE